MRVSATARYVGYVLALSGCLPEDRDYDETRARGDLGAGEFVYGCLNDTDTACSGEDDELPLAIAVGGRFDLRFDIKSGPQPTVIAPASDFIRAIEGGFQVRGAGQFALLAVNGNREVVDIKHLYGADIDEVRVQVGDELPATTLRLEPRQSIRVLAMPFDSRDVKLGGALSYSWSSSDASLVSIESLAELSKVRVRAGNKPGRAALWIDVAGKTFTVPVEIGAADLEPQDAGASVDAGRADASVAGDGDAPAESAEAAIEGGAP